MNPYIQNLNRIEFLITLDCTGRCKHCSEGEHGMGGGHLDGDAAAGAVYKLCGQYYIDSLMTFGGEPLLYFEEVCKIHCAAREMNIPKRQIITNGFFRREKEKIQDIVTKLAESGVNQVLLSADAFHQETIPLETVKIFAKAVRDMGLEVRLNPAWLVDKDDPNPYNIRTKEIMAELCAMGLEECKGNIIFPEGNALKYLGKYFDAEKQYASPYTENPEDIHAICIDPNGDVLGGNIYKSNILDILQNYTP